MEIRTARPERSVLVPGSVDLVLGLGLQPQLASAVALHQEAACSALRALPRRLASNSNRNSHSKAARQVSVAAPQVDSLARSLLPVHFLVAPQPHQVSQAVGCLGLAGQHLAAARAQVSAVAPVPLGEAYLVLLRTSQRLVVSVAVQVQGLDSAHLLGQALAAVPPHQREAAAYLATQERQQLPPSAINSQHQLHLALVSRTSRISSRDRLAVAFLEDSEIKTNSKNPADYLVRPHQQQAQAPAYLDNLHSSNHQPVEVFLATNNSSLVACL